MGSIELHFDTANRLADHKYSVYYSSGRGRSCVVFGDGRCLFRSVAVFLYHSLHMADRGHLGELTSLEFAQEEQLKADLLRAEICNVLSEHKDLLREMSGNLLFMLDSSQTNDNLQVGKSRDCTACDTGQCVCWILSFS